MKRPASLVIVASLFVLAGLAALWDILSGLFLSGLPRLRISINPGVLALFIGIGLLRFRRGWRTFALVCVWLTFAAVVISVGLLIFSRASVTLSFFSWQAPAAQHPFIAWITVASFALLAFWIYRVLTRRDIRRLFALEDVNDPSNS